MIPRYAKRRDETEPEIVNGLRRCGYQVRHQDFPDLAVRRIHWPAGVVQFLEVDGITRNRKRAPKQLDFLREWSIPKVKTLDEALDLLRPRDAAVLAIARLGAIPSPPTSASCVSKPISASTP